MKQIALWLYFPLLILTSSCSSAKLSEKEALRLIREANGYPQLVAVPLVDIKPESGIGREIERLIKEGYMVPGDYWKGHTIAEKGKSLVQKCVWNDFYKSYEIFRPFVYNQDAKRITEILIDSKSKTAVVKYEVANFPTEYLGVLNKLDTEKTLGDKSGILQVGVEEMKFKKWDQGWRVMR